MKSFIENRSCNLAASGSRTGRLTAQVFLEAGTTLKKMLDYTPYRPRKAWHFAARCWATNLNGNLATHDARYTTNYRVGLTDTAALLDSHHICKALLATPGLTNSLCAYFRNHFADAITARPSTSFRNHFANPVRSCF